MYQFDKISDLIIENTNQYIVAIKPHGMPCVPDQTEDTDLCSLLSAYCKRDLYPVHRIDRPVGGIVVYAKSSNAAAALTARIINGQVAKTYYAIVEGQLDHESATLEQYIVKKGSKAYVSKEATKGSKAAKLTYQLLNRLDRYTILLIQTETGRFHQIRAQLSSIGHPIKGDVKYGARRKNKDRSIYLYAGSLTMHHPITGEEVVYEHRPDASDSLWNLLP